MTIIHLLVNVINFDQFKSILIYVLFQDHSRSMYDFSGNFYLLFIFKN